MRVALIVSLLALPALAQQLGNGPVALVEFSDYQCPHCAAAVGPLEALATKDRKGQVRLCSKYFPFPNHPRAPGPEECQSKVEVG